MHEDALFWHRLQFAFTIVFHYLFPALTMGLALLIVVMKGAYLRTNDDGWNEAARFWIRIFGINFVVGVVTGIPMEFQFGTNWGAFSRYAGNVIGHTLAMEGLFAFFLESSFLALLVMGEKRVGRIGHFACALALFLGSWLSGYFIIATNAFMQHSVGHEVGADGMLHLVDFSAFLLNPWALAVHNMMASVAVAAFVAAAGACALRREPCRRSEVSWSGRRRPRRGCSGGVSTGDQHARLVASAQPASLAAMEVA
jgi:cytochrome d ubiquinol oxidase subunit I